MTNGPVQVGYAFECMKKNGKTYGGSIVKVASYPRGTLVTVKYFEDDEYDDNFNGRTVKVQNPAYRSIYLEDCITWTTEQPAIF